MIVLHIASNGNTIFRGHGPVSITKIVDAGVCILSSVMHAIGQSAGETSKHVFCGSIVTEFRIRIMLGELHDSKGNIRPSVHCKIEQFSNKLTIFGLEIVEVGMNISGSAERKGWVHGERYGIAVTEAMFFEKVDNVVLLMHPQLSSSTRTDVLDAQMLDDWP